jgi:glycosyltransferase involved in cell wall biosynthesis
VVVPTHNRRDSVLRLLDALKAQASAEGGVDPDRFEVVVVADG